MLSPKSTNSDSWILFEEAAPLNQPVALGDHFEPTKEDLQIGQVRAAAANGCAVSQLFLGTYFLMPTRKANHFSEAIEWLEAAAEQGCPHATGLLTALCFEKALRVLLNC